MIAARAPRSGPWLLSLVVLSTACSTVSTPSLPLPSLAPTRVSSAEFDQHLTELVERVSPLVSAIGDAVELGDEDALAAAAAELYAVMSADEDWQRANAEAILGQCYDQEAEMYSNGFVDISGGATQITAYIRSGTRSKLGYGISLIQDGAREFQAAHERLQEVSC